MADLGTYTYVLTATDDNSSNSVRGPLSNTFTFQVDFVDNFNSAPVMDQTGPSVYNYFVGEAVSVPVPSYEDCNPGDTH